MSPRILAMIGAALLLAPSSAHAGIIVGGSSLLTLSDVTQIEGWLGEGPLTLTNAYSKSAGDTSITFHNAVNGIGRTIVILEFLSGTGYVGSPQIIGGYNPSSWNSSGSYTLTPSTSAMTAFIFNLTQSFEREQINQYQTYNNGSYGPTFGGGHDIYVNSNLSNGYVHNFSYCNPGAFTKSPGTACVSNPGGDVLGLTGPGTQDAIWGRIEVFTLSPYVVPEPATGILVGAGLAALAAAHRRRARIH